MRIFRPLEAMPGMFPLAWRSRLTLDALLGSSGEWLRPTGGLFVAPDPHLLQALVGVARAVALRYVRLERGSIVRLVPVLEDGEATAGLLVPSVGVTDIHAVTTRLAQAAAAAGATTATGHEVARILAPRGRVEGVQVTSGETIAAPAVVITAGAWSAALGASCGAAMALRSFRRHLVHLDVPDVPPSMPVVWQLGDEVYLRPEPGGVLASPCDEEAWPPSDPPPAAAAMELLASRLVTLAPRLAFAPVRRAWACLRSFAPDRSPVAGADPRVRGLYWLTGLGGSGMTIGVAAGEVVAALICGRKHPLAAMLTPARLQAA